MEALERDSLLSDLEHSDEEVRRIAVERLSLLSQAEAVVPLVERLGDPSWRVRKAAVERLTALPDAAGPVRALVGALADGENSGRRNAALEALTRYGTTALPVLVEASHESDVDVRKQSVDALAAIGDPGAARRLAELLDDEDANVRAAAAEALGTIGAREAVSQLTERAALDVEPLVKLSSLRSLGQLETPLPLEQLRSALADPLLRAAALLLLGWSTESGSFEALLEGLASPARSVREAAMEALLKRRSLAAPDAADRLGARLRSSLADAPFLDDALVRLEDAPLTTRLVLVQFLGWLGRADCVIPLLGAAQDEALADVALDALAEAGPTAEASIQAAWGTLGEASRLCACRLFARTDGAEGEALLQRALELGDAALRGVAATALAARGSTAALPAMVTALRRATAPGAEALGGEAEGQAELEQAIRNLLASASPVLGDRVAALLEAEIDGAPEPFRMATAHLLSCLPGVAQRQRIELLMSDPSAAVRRAAVEALVRVAPGRLDLLRCALADEAPLVRIGAAVALAGSGDASVVADLATLLEDDEPRVVAAALRAVAAWARVAAGDEARAGALRLLSVGLANGGASSLAALDALRAIGGEDAVALARSALASVDPEIAEAAVACVGAHAERSALAVLLPCLAHEAWNVRARVAQVMEERRHVAAIPALIRQLESERDEFVRGAVLAALGTLESH
jgi:HEAT repeat protein